MVPCNISVILRAKGVSLEGEMEKEAVYSRAGGGQL